VKITSIQTIQLRHELSRPAGPASVLNRARQTLLVRMETDEGLVGWGETAPLGGIRGVIEDDYAPLLLGRDPTWVQRGWRTAWMAPFENALAVAALDIAVHDLIGKALGVPIHRLYGGALRTRVPAYASGMVYLEGIHPRDRWIEEALGLVERGFRAIKVRIGRYPADVELPLLAALRDAVPAAVGLSVDAWGSYTLPTALRVGRELGAMGFLWYEEPLPQHGYHGYETLTAALDIAVSGGEMLQNRDAFKALFDRHAVDIVQPDVTLVGGIAEMLFIADLARLYGIRTLPHSWDGAVTEAASLQVAALLPEPTLMPGVDVPLLEHDTTENPFVDGGLREPLVFRDGAFELPTGPGLGIELDEDWLRGYEVDPHPAVTLRDAARR
jgi:D-galactarolactone cycloisomerase